LTAQNARIWAAILVIGIERASDHNQAARKAPSSTTHVTQREAEFEVGRWPQQVTFDRQEGSWPVQYRTRFDRATPAVARRAATRRGPPQAPRRAVTISGDSRWLAGVEMSMVWFLGHNDAGVPMFDEQTGGGCDRLGRTGRSRNQGAESTLAMLSVMQQSRRLATVRH
jgi:hypothetical protein